MKIRRRWWRSPLVWTFVLAVALLLVVGGWLLADPKTSRVDALKTGGIAAGSVIALYALWINDRRRRVEESRQDTERQRHELENQRTDHDRERVADERFARSVELLGHEADQVRVGALHALAGLARSRPSYTQTALDVLCSYLRRPFEHPEYDAALGLDTASWHEQAINEADRERQVRRTAQQLIRDLLPHYQDPDGKAYGLDLTGARLDRFKLARRRVWWLGVQRGKLLHSVDLSDAVFEDMVYFTGANLLGPADLRRVTIRGVAGFKACTAAAEFDCTGATFEAEVAFEDATFQHDAVFADSTFHSTLDLTRAHLHRHANFRFSRKPEQVAFYKTTLNPAYELLLPPTWDTEDHTGDGAVWLVERANIR